MAVIKDNYLFPIYCDNAIPINGEKNFHATGADLVETIEDSDLFVKKSGDTMSGDLEMQGLNLSVFTNNVDTKSGGLTLSSESDKYLSLQLDYTISHKPVMTDIIIGRTGDLISCSNDRLTDVQDPIDDQDAVTKKFLDNAINILQNEVIELEEELEAIAPSLARGTYYYDETIITPGTSPSEAYFYIVDENNQVTNDYEEARGVILHNTNIEGFTRTWGEVELDNLIQLYDRPDEDVLLGRITNIDTGSYTDSVRFDIENIGASGFPNNLSDEDGNFIVRLNIFEAPSGGDASEFVMKAGGNPGGEMTGRLELQNQATNTYYSPNDVVGASIRFQHKNADGSDGPTRIDIFQNGNGEDIVIDGPVRVNGQIVANNFIGFWDGTSSSVSGACMYGSSSRGYLKTSHNTNSSASRLGWGNSGGDLLYGSTSLLTWKSDGIEIPKKLYAHNSAGNSSTLTQGTSGQVLKTTGDKVYWGTDNTGGGSSFTPGNQVAEDNCQNNWVGYEVGGFRFCNGQLFFKFSN